MSSLEIQYTQVSARGARTLLDSAVAFAREKEETYCIAVVDASGVLKAFERMDGAPLLSIQVAQDKAYTAAGFGMPTDGWYDFIKDDGPLAIGAPSGIDRLVVFGGGIPIESGGRLIGAVGVSGGHYSQDQAVAQAAVDAFEAAKREE